MNRTKRDYCLKGNHPNWREFVARYDMSNIAWPWLGNFCPHCGARVNGVGSGSPDSRVFNRLKMLRDGKATGADLLKYQERIDKFTRNAAALRESIRRKSIRRKG